MIRQSTILVLVLFVLGSSPDGQEWVDDFNLSRCSWSSTGKNDFFILEPGYQEILEGSEEGDLLRLEITVLNGTKKVGDVETRIVEEKEILNGKVIEISRNFYAVCGPENDIFYFGEETEIFQTGRAVDREETWIANKNGAKPGLAMPSKPVVGARFYQEFAPGVSMDRAEIVSIHGMLKTPAGEFHDCLKIEETSPLEPHEKEYKIYAKGIGLIKDEDMVLIQYRMVALP